MERPRPSPRTYELSKEQRNRLNIRDVSLFQRGATEVLPLLIKRNEEFIRKFAEKHFGDVATGIPDFDIDDLTQEGLITLLSTAKGFDTAKGGLAFQRYLVRNLHDSMKSYMAKTQSNRTTPQPEPEIHPLVHPTEAFIRRITNDGVYELIERYGILNERELRILYWSAGKDSPTGAPMTRTEIARYHGCSIQWVSNIEKRALGKLRSPAIIRLFFDLDR